MLARDNLLLLDEPTNHLDIGSREALEEALAGYDGTIFIVSHDRYFINRLATRVLRLTNEGCQSFEGGYDQYLERFQEAERTKTEQAPPKENAYKKRKEQESARRRLQGRIRRTEEAVAAAEEAVASLHRQLEDEAVAADYTRVLELTAELEEQNRRLEEQMALWEELQLEAEAMEEETPL